jgi:gliding motility-associated lipoprotein GldK
MKNILLISAIAIAALSSCGTSSRGELVGVQDLIEFYPSDPYGMVFIPRGTFTMGANNGDVPYAHTTPKKLVTMHAFHMDQTEITNNEYRQFVHWVRDSIARTLLAEAMVEGFEYIEETADGEFLEVPYLNWDAPLDWSSNDEEIELVLEEMYLPIEDRIMGRKEFDTRSWNHRYTWVDKSPASQRSNRYDPVTKTYREGFSRQDLVHEGNVYVYPDTLAWMHDFSYTFNEPMFNTYFWHPGYGEYPVTGVNWEQATAFCNWRTAMRQERLTLYQRQYETEFRLPTEAEWEYAARGGKSNQIYPWGGPYSRNSKGCLLANFKPVRGNYIADGYAFTAPSMSYWPNDYGLYNMAGNVSEWCSTPFEPSASLFMSDMNPYYTYDADVNSHPMLKRKVVKGGSWKDVGAFLQIAAKDYEYQDTSKCYIGFRCVKTYAAVETVNFGY